MGKLKHPQYYVFVEHSWHNEITQLGFYANLKSAYNSCIRHMPGSPLELFPLLSNNLYNKKTERFITAYELRVPFRDSNYKSKTNVYRIVDAKLFLPGGYHEFGGIDDFKPMRRRSARVIEYYEQDLFNEEFNTIRTNIY